MYKKNQINIFHAYRIEIVKKIKRYRRAAVTSLGSREQKKPFVEYFIARTRLRINNHY